MSDSWLATIPAPGLMADLLLLGHAIIVAFVVIGQVLIMLGGVRGWRWVRRLWLRLTHLGLIVFVTVQGWLGALCPLTVWENRLRLAAGEAGRGESFIQHWVGEVIYYDLPQWLFVLAYTLFAALVVFTWWWLPPKWRRDRISS